MTSRLSCKERFPKDMEYLLEKRYTQLAFFLRMVHEKPFHFCEGRENGYLGDFFLHRRGQIQEEIQTTFSKIELNRLELIYFYGIGLGHYAETLLKWLEEDKRRDLVLIEENVEALRLFLFSQRAFILLSHPQIHLRFLIDPTKWKQFFEERAYEFPIENIELIPLESLKRKKSRQIASFRLHLMRRTTVHHAIFMEEKYYPYFLKNMVPNFFHLKDAFYLNRFQNAFQNVPALICGAGPSLKDELDEIKKKEHQALIIAGGSAITALSHRHILPHLAIAIDPNEEEYKRFRANIVFEVPLLYTNRLFSRVFETFNGPLGYVRAVSGGPVESWIEEELGIEKLSLRKGFDIEALSVTTTAIQVAAMMGCNPIILVGVDLAFTNQSFYAPGVIGKNIVSLEERKKESRASERLMKRKDGAKKPVYTLVKWIMESETISRFAKKNKDISFVNVTSKGIGFKGIPNQKLSHLSFPSPFDIRGRIHQLIEENRLAFSVGPLIQRLKNSLKKGKNIIEGALSHLKSLQGKNKDPEDGKMFFYQMEFEELIAYKCCFDPLALTFEKEFLKTNRPIYWDMEEKEKFAMRWKRLFAKWIHRYELNAFYLKELEKI